MKVSLRWLGELVASELEVGEVARLLTMAGLEVEGRSSFAPISGVVVAEVRGKRPHPDAAKLTLVEVWDGRETTQVVCGAPNVPEPGARVLWARPGARLVDGMEIAPRALRGIVSPGMLCAEDELGFGESHEGIVVLGDGDRLAPGEDLAATLGLPDQILEVNVTPNRPDCLGHLGVARELAALMGRPLAWGAADRGILADAAGRQVAVELRDPAGCPRYTALVLEELRIGPSPLALRLRLGSLGVRSISNVVDATNLTMLETGQPLHAFDLDRVAGSRIIVRRATPGERTRTLDGQERVLEGGDLVICDGEDRPVALAGVMGGADSEVSDSTRRVLLEAAYFDPTAIRRTARRLGLHSEASHRFERGTDPSAVLEASLRCASRFVELGGGRVAGQPVDRYPSPIAPRELSLRGARTRRVLGVAELGVEEQGALLERIGLGVERAAEDRLAVTVPTFRPDLTREIDLVEEVARLRGYEQVPSKLPRLHAAPGPLGDAEGEAVRDALCGLGFDEAITFGFVAPQLVAALGLPETDPRARPLRLANPLREEQSALRTSLVPGLVGALERNLARGQTDVRLFELGHVFLPGEPGALPEEPRHVAAVLTGRREGWLQPGTPVDVFDIKGAAEELLVALGYAVQVSPSTEPWLHPGVQGGLQVGERSVGAFGELHPELVRLTGLKTRPLVFEIDLGALPPASAALFRPLARFPQVTRDLSFFIDEKIPVQEIGRAIERTRDPLCVAFRVLEDYREPGKVPPGQKGMLWSFTYRAEDRTLTDAEVQAVHDQLLEGLRSSFAITQR